MKQSKKLVVLTPMRSTRKKDDRANPFMAVDEVIQKSITKGWSCLFIGVQVVGFVYNEKIPRSGFKDAMVSALAVFP